MSIIKQPFQMLPFSPSIEFQWRLKEDCHNDICDVPIIPKGKFVPFAIIANSNNIGDIKLHCHDEGYSYIRTENFTRNNCISGCGSIISFSKTFTSTISNLDAQTKAMNDSLYLIEGQQYANINGSCVTAPVDFFDTYSSQSELDNYSSIDAYPCNLSITSGKLQVAQIDILPRTGIVQFKRNITGCAGAEEGFMLSFDIIDIYPAPAPGYPITIRANIFGHEYASMATIGHHEYGPFGVDGEIDNILLTISHPEKTGSIYCELDNLKLESI